MKRILCVTLALTVLCSLFSLGIINVSAANEVSIFGDISKEEITVSADGVPINLSTKFAVKVPGTINKVRLYTSKDEKGLYTVEIWSVIENAVIAGPYNWELKGGTVGWQEFALPEALHIDAGRDYIVAIRNN